MTERVRVTHNLTQCEKASLRDTVYGKKMGLAHMSERDRE